MYKQFIMAGLLSLPVVTVATEYPVPIQQLEQRGLKIQAEFEAPGGITGFVGQANGQSLTIYLTEDGEYAFLGQMVDGNGQNLSQQHMEQHEPRPDLESVWEQLENADWIAEGDDAQRVVYVFVDPNCPFCSAFWRAARPYVGENAQLRHILVDILRPDSLGKGARILSADSPIEALTTHELNHENGGIEPLAEIPSDIEAKIQSNTRLMSAIGAHATPAIYFRDANGEVRQLMGMQPPAVIAEQIFGQPLKETDEQSRSGQ